LPTWIKPTDIVHNIRGFYPLTPEYGAPEKALTIAERRFKTEDLGVDDVPVKVRARPVHPGDIHILSALPQGGPIVPIPEGTLRVPGFEGVGTILQIGTNPEAAKRFSESQRVAFFPAMGSWAEYVVVRYESLLPVSEEIRIKLRPKCSSIR
jgi:NADPH:quinone reductase-like Zn-dependent oxidoreductase